MTSLQLLPGYNKCKGKLSFECNLSVAPLDTDCTDHDIKCQKYVFPDILTDDMASTNISSCTCPTQLFQ